MISDHLDRFGGLAVVDWVSGPAPDPATSMPRFSFDWQGTSDVPTLLRAYLAQPDAPATRGIVIGPWIDVMYESPPEEVLDVLVAGRDRLPGLRVLFFGDITMDEAEISWICNTDQSRLYAAFAQLEHVGIRGGSGLRLPGLALPQLRSLVIETGGMSSALQRDVLAADLPALTHLELFTGAETYGAQTRVQDLSGLLSGDLFPQLTHLGVRNSEYTDDVCEALAGSPLLGRLEVLDLSLGTLTDRGARALAAAPAVTGLKKLDVHHHYLSDEGEALLRGLDIEVDLTGREAPDEYEGEISYYVAIGE